MEKDILKRFGKLLKILVLNSVFVFAICEPAFAQTPSAVSRIRFPVWAEIDAYPGSEQAISEEFAFPISRIKEVTPFLISGMVYGWTFSYTPSDKSRGVEEYFELVEIQPLNPVFEKITYSSPWLENERLNCWCEYTRTEPQIQNYKLWSSIQNPVIHGTGYGKLEKGFDGIKEAAEDSVKNAVRDYYREIIKNKPKEITGSVLIREVPVLGVKSGQYIINLDFFLECGKIKEYLMY